MQFPIKKARNKAVRSPFIWVGNPGNRLLNHVLSSYFERDFNFISLERSGKGVEGWWRRAVFPFLHRVVDLSRGKSCKLNTQLMCLFCSKKVKQKQKKELHFSIFCIKFCWNVNGFGFCCALLVSRKRY